MQIETSLCTVAFASRLWYPEPRCFSCSAAACVDHDGLHSGLPGACRSWLAPDVVFGPWIIRYVMEGQLDLASAQGPHWARNGGWAGSYDLDRPGCHCFLMMQWVVLPCKWIGPMGVLTVLYVSVKFTEVCFYGLFLRYLVEAICMSCMERKLHRHLTCAVKAANLLKVFFIIIPTLMKLTFLNYMIFM